MTLASTGKHVNPGLHYLLVDIHRTLLVSSSRTLCRHTFPALLQMPSFALNRKLPVCYGLVTQLQCALLTFVRMTFIIKFNCPWLGCQMMVWINQG